MQPVSSAWQSLGVQEDTLGILGCSPHTKNAATPSAGVVSGQSGPQDEVHHGEGVRSGDGITPPRNVSQSPFTAASFSLDCGGQAREVQPAFVPPAQQAEHPVSFALLSKVLIWLSGISFQATRMCSLEGQ